MKPLTHMQRHAEASQARWAHKRRSPPADYPAGHFTALIYAHDWPPGFVPSITDADIAADATRRMAQRSSTENAEAGVGHAGLDLGLPGSLRTLRPVALWKVANGR